MNKVQFRREMTLTVLCAILLTSMVLCLNLPWSPIFQPVVGADSGMFAYIGSAITHGQIPYRDVWEQKPPVGFYLDALAIWLLGQTPWAIWWLNLVWVALSATVFLLVVRKMMGLLTGFMASLVFILGVMNPSIFQGGNLMEIYGLLPQVLVIGCAYLFFLTRYDRWVFLGGLATGIAFMTKQTTIALGLSSAFAILLMSLLWRELKSLLPRLLFFITGFVIPIGIAALYWLAMGALSEFVDGIFLYSKTYVGVGAPFLWSIKHTALSVFPKMFVSKLYYIASLSGILYLADKAKGFLLLISQKSKALSAVLDSKTSPVELTMLVIFIALPIELIFTSLGGRNFGHYFLTLLPAVTTAIAYIFWKVATFLQNKKFVLRDSRTWLAASGMLLAFASIVWSVIALAGEVPTIAHMESFPKIFSRQFDMGEIGNYIVANTEPADPVLVWHIHIGTNFITNRRVPQRILFPAELFIPVEKVKSNLEEFLGQLEQTPPRLIIVQKNSSAGLPFVNVPVDQMCPNGACIQEMAAAMKNPDAIVELEKFRQYFLAHYTLDTQIADWLIYKRIP